MGKSMRGLFMTATDTGAGKTFVTALIARTLRRAGAAVRVCKPVATGADWIDGRWLSEDTRLLAEAADDAEYDADNAVGVPDAGRAAGGGPAGRGRAAAGRPGRGGARRAVARGRLVLVEGVGGLLCPLTETETVADLAAELGLPLLVVARRSLGTLNHTLLTLEVAWARRLRVAGVVVSETTPVAGAAEETNVEELRRRISVPLAGRDLRTSGAWRRLGSAPPWTGDRC